MSVYRTFFALFVLLFSTALFGQCPPPGTVFTSQQQINTLARSYPSCTVFEGNLVIQEARPGAIQNLNGLSNLREVNGNLIVRLNRDLSTLTGLGSLSRISGELNIQSNGQLTTLSGLDRLTYVGSQAMILSNPSLTSLTGLNSLRTINGTFYLKKNPSLSGLEALGQLSTINGDLSISENPSLTSLDGLNQLGSLGTTAPRAQLELNENPRLSDIVALAALDFSKLTYLQITKCPSLTTNGRSDQANVLCSYLQNAGRARIYGNGAGFDSLESVRQQCN
jgi:hypothetical protein